MPVPDHTPSTIGQPLIGELVEERFDLGFKRGCEHPARPFARNLGQRILDCARLAQRNDAGVFLHSVLLPSPPVYGFLRR